MSKPTALSNSKRAGYERRYPELVHTDDRTEMYFLTVLQLR